MDLEHCPPRNLEWKVLTECNYNCWYCLDGDRSIPCPGAEQAAIYADALIKNLNKPWVVQITGGEPFINPDFILKFSGRLVAAGHWLKIFSNLSADEKTYDKFLEVYRQSNGFPHPGLQ